MHENEIRNHAKRLIEVHNEEYEFCLVYEDEDLEDVTEDEWQAIHDAMYAARITVAWPENTEN